MDAKYMFHGDFIFIKHASDYVFIWHQVTLSASYTIKYKMRFEVETFNMGVA